VKKVVLGVLFVCLLLAAPPVQASQVVYDFTLSNITLTGVVGPPYGTVTVTDIGVGQVSIETKLNSPLLMFGETDAFGFFSTFAGLTLNVTQTNFSVGSGPMTMDGFGSFDYIVAGSVPPATTGTNDLTFTVSGAGITAANLLAANGSGHQFAAHVYDSAITSASQTGYISGGPIELPFPPPPPPVPEPATMVLLGTGLVGCASALRRRARKQ
jgi:hypothetical protein